jgi:cytochrome c-type biogenesis protein
MPPFRVDLRVGSSAPRVGLVWTPRAGPVLGSILTLVATSKDVAWASVLPVVYAIGAAPPMLAIAYGGQPTTRVRSTARYSPRLQQAFGAIDAIPSPHPVW